MDRVFEVRDATCTAPEPATHQSRMPLYRNHCGFDPITAITMNESTMKIAE